MSTCCYMRTTTIEHTQNFTMKVDIKPDYVVCQVLDFSQFSGLIMIFMTTNNFQVSLNARVVRKAVVTAHHFASNVLQDTTRIKPEKQNVYHVL